MAKKKIDADTPITENTFVVEEHETHHIPGEPQLLVKIGKTTHVVQNPEEKISKLVRDAVNILNSLEEQVTNGSYDENRLIELIKNLKTL